MPLADFLNKIDLNFLISHGYNIIYVLWSYNHDLCKIQKPKATIIAPSAEAGDDAWKDCFRYADLKIQLF